MKQFHSVRTMPFLLTEGGIYIAFLALDAMDLKSWGTWAKYLGILLCLAFALAWAVRGGSRITAAALALTAAADSLLLVAQRGYLWGVLLFLGVQTLYLIRLRRAGAAAALPLRLALPLLAGVVLYQLGQATPLNLLAGLYFSQLVANTCLAWTLRGRTWRLFALGLTLFIGCDVCVGLFNSPGLVPQPLYDFATVGMWLFYLPSQVFITLSARPGKETSL